jgi:hypothetical protein
MRGEAEKIFDRRRIGLVQRLNQPQPGLVDNTIDVVPGLQVGKRAVQDFGGQAAEAAAGQLEELATGLAVALAQAVQESLQMGGVRRICGHGASLESLAAARLAASEVQSPQAPRLNGHWLLLRIVGAGCGRKRNG